MIIMRSLRKRSGERIVIVQGVKRCVRVAYVKATTRKLTMSAATELGVLRTFQLVWLVVARIG